MSQPLQLLIVEDSKDDLTFILHALRRGGYEVTWKAVDTPEAMRAALESQNWDVITSDHSMPHFSAPAALALARELRPEVPFIIVSGEIDLNLAVSLIRGGARDYTQKRELERLVPVIERELRESALRRERQRLDAALAESREQLRDVLEHSLDAAYKRNLQTDSYDYLSPVFTRITGYTLDEVRSSPVGTVLNMMHPDDRPEIEHLMSEALSKDEGTDYQMEYRFRHKDGSYRWLQDRFSVVRDGGGRALALIGSVSDITESRQVEEALRLSEQNFREIFNSTHEAIFIDDAETGQIIDVNETMLKLYGYEHKAEVLAGTIGNLSANEPPFTDDRAQELVRTAIREGPQVFEWLAKRRDGTQFWTEVSLAKSQIGGRSRVLAVVRDISERRRSAAEHAALLEIMQGLAVTNDLQEILELIHHSIAKVIYAENFFIVLYNKDTELFEEVYSVDRYDPPAPPSRLDKSITAYIYRTGQPQIMTQVLFNQLEAQGEVELVGTNSASWMGAPLTTAEGTIGVLVVQDYDTPGRYAEGDKNFLAYIGSQVALAIERSRTRAALEEKETWHRAILQTATDGFAMVNLQGRFREVNEAYCRMTGYSAPELLGMSIADMEYNETAVDIAARTQQIVELGQARFQTRHRCKNGAILDLEISIQYRDNEGGQLVAFLTDITERKRAENALHESENRYRILFEESPVAIWEEDFSEVKKFIDALASSGVKDFRAHFENNTPDLQKAVALVRVLDINQKSAEYLGVKSKAEVIQKISVYFSEDSLETVREEMIALAQGSLTFNSELTVRDGLNQRRTRMLYLSIVPGFEDSWSKVLVTLIDISERKLAEEEIYYAKKELERSHRALLNVVEDHERAEERVNQLNAELEQRVADRTAQLTDANQELEAFSYSVSHDLRSPLRALDGFSTILIQEYAGQLDEEGKHLLTAIRESARRMDQLIRDLLNLSRVTRADFTRQPVDLSELAGGIAAELAAQAPGRRVEFEISAGMVVQGDRNLLKIVLENLLSNAFKFTGSCGRALIQVGSLEQEGKRVYFVRDNGAGFNMNHASKLFGAFQRLHSESEFPGTGIGLATVQRIIHRHGGRIWAEGAVNQGATFYFTLKSD